MFNLKMIRPIDLISRGCGIQWQSTCLDLISSYQEIQRMEEQINEITMRNQILSEGGAF
jgi:hypothetical protein